MDEFRDRILSGQGLQYAADELVPPAFAAALDERRTLDLYAASVSLMARLSADEPAGCLTEEIMAVAVINQAKARLEMSEANGEVSTEDAQVAAEAMNDLFELFQDDDVLDMFERSPPTLRSLDMIRSTSSSRSWTSASSPGFGRLDGPPQQGISLNLKKKKREAGLAVKRLDEGD